MSAPWREDDEEFRVGGVRGGFKSKPRFSFTEVKLLLEAVKRNRYIILRKFNQGVSAETKKQTWAEITNQINDLGENHREVRQIMKKWADLKCDGKRRIVALRGPNGSNLRKKNLGPVERMVHKILMMSPKGDGESEAEFGEDDDFSKLHSKGPAPTQGTYSYLSLTDSSFSVGGGGAFDISPLSSPDKDLGGDPFHSSSEFDLADDGDHSMDFDENDDSTFSSYHDAPPPPPSTSTDPLTDEARLRAKPVHTYSRNSSQSQTPSRPPPGPSSDGEAASSSAPPPSQSPKGSNAAAPPSADTESTSGPPASSVPPPPAPFVPASHQPSSSSSSSAPPPGRPSASDLSDPLPAGASSRRAQDHVAQMACQSVQQQRASRMLLSSVSQSLEALAQSVQLLVETQQEFVQESLLLQRETVDVLRDFSSTALTMLRDKSSSGPVSAHHHHHHPAPRF